MNSKLLPASVLLLLACHWMAAATEVRGQTNTMPAAEEAKCIIVELYLSDDQPTSEMALAGARQLAQSRAGLKLVPRSIDTSEKGRKRLKKIARYFKIDETSTPVIYCGNRIIRGGKSADDFERQLRSALRIEVFTRIGCSRCKLAKAWLPTLERRYPGMEVVYREITNDPDARQDLNHLVVQYQKAATSTPVFHFCNQMVVGFDRAETSGNRIEQVLRRWSSSCTKSEKKTSSSDQSSVSYGSALEVAQLVPFLPRYAILSVCNR